MSLLIAGGHADPNLTALRVAADTMSVPVDDLRHGTGPSPAFTWDVESNSAWLNGRPLQPRAAFLRYDVFASMADPRPEISQRATGWFQTAHAWLNAHPEVRVFNRQPTAEAGCKPNELLRARQAGLLVPRTLITNELARLKQLPAEATIAKPVAGGDYCYKLEEAVPGLETREGTAAMPAIVQNRLVAPEIRIYIIAGRALAFEMKSPSLDYRVRQDAEVIPLREVPVEEKPLRRLMALLQMDYGAADFKTDPETGRLVFLELNTSPMFARFDEVSGGALCRAMVEQVISTRP